MKKTEITFGTDGFRGIIAKEFTFDTVERIIKAISLYLRNLKSNKNTVIIGYDPRFMAKDFAIFSAELMKTYGFNIILSSKVVPTPIVAYCAKYYPNSIGAIMLTASHNPKEYQGIKFIPNYGGPATKKITDEILKYVDKEISVKNEGNISIQNLEDDYIKHLENIIDFKLIAKKQPKIIYDGLFSSSIGYFDKILEKNNIKFESFNMYHSSDFGGGLPEPKEKYMKNKKTGYIVMANDGDADRYGVLDEDGNYVSPNIILALLLKYLKIDKKIQGKMIKTVGVSKLVEIVAEKTNTEIITTPVGFKWLSEAMRNNETILAGEDSGGLSSGNHIPEKDGIYANLLILEMMSYKNKSLKELVNEINDFAGIKFYTDRIDVKLENDIQAEKLKEKFDEFNFIADYKIINKNFIDGTKITLEDNLSSLLIRKSGTEPLYRFYIESNDTDKLNKIKVFIKQNAL